MKIRSVVTGDVIDVPQDAADHLTSAGIYEPAEESSTAPAPMTTDSMPARTKKAR